MIIHGIGKSARSRDGNPLKVITVNDLMQTGYTYGLAAPVGRQFDPDFGLSSHPRRCCSWVFCGKYMTDCRDEFPPSWFERATLSPTRRNCALNFVVDASQPLSVWRNNGWIHPDDPRVWFQWYCRYTSAAA